MALEDEWSRALKPLVSIDLEATGVNVATDFIISVGLFRCFEAERHWLAKPPVPIPKEVEELTGITNEIVADCPPFREVAAEVHGALQGMDLLGFNLLNFDVPLLWEEFYRAGIEWDLSGTALIDAGNIFKRKEERTLSAALKFYCGGDLHAGAHNALADCEATERVFEAQLGRYPELAQLSRSELAHFSRYDEERLSLDGKIVKGLGGQAIYNFGKSKGLAVTADPGFGYWMLGKDFPEQTKAVLRRLLNGEQGNSD